VDWLILRDFNLLRSRDNRNRGGGNLSEMNKKGGYLVAWRKATRLKEQGGLGIIDLRAHNTTLLLKFLNKFYNRVQVPWVQLTWSVFYSRPIPPHHRKGVGSFWWRDIMSLSDNFFHASFLLST
jgi:hypothetical protein